MANQESRQSMFGDIPSLIRENVKYLSYSVELDDFTCVPCEKIIEKSLTVDNTTKNFEKHLLSTAHRNNITISNDELAQQLSKLFCGNVPPIILMNAETLSMNGKDFVCVICEKNIQVSNNNISVTESNFSNHLLSFGHEKILDNFNETLDQLNQIYGGTSRTTLNNSRFLRKNGTHYLCTICDKQLMVHPTDVEETEKCFEKHFHSLQHIRNAKQVETFCLTPELEIIFSSLPNHMLGNLEYFSNNGFNFFCSLCSTNIKCNRYDSYETELNLKSHILSPFHEENMDKSDPNKKVYNRLFSLFKEFPVSVQKNLKYLTINVDDFYCEICKVGITKYDKLEQTKESLSLHFESLHHLNMLNFKYETALEALQVLSTVFGTIPEIIQNNLQHIKFNGSTSFECVLCNKILKAKFDGDYNDDTSVTKINFVQHLKSNGHEAKLQEVEKINIEIMSYLKDTFYPLPQYVINNSHHLSYNKDSGSFECILCSKVIAIVPRNKAELTEPNFRSHFLSVEHLAKLKHNANLLMDATEKLEFIFSKIPNFIVNNIQHIEIRANRYYCTLCDVKISAGGAESTEIQFRQHLYGSRHRDNLKQMDNEDDEAFKQLDLEFGKYQSSS